MTRWFGASWGAAVCEEQAHIDVPIGQVCSWCSETFIALDQGLLIDSVGDIPAQPYHVECFMRVVIGSVGHLTGKCSCYGGDDEDPPNMSKRDAARLAFAYFRVYGATSHGKVRRTHEGHIKDCAL